MTLSFSNQDDCVSVALLSCRLGSGGKPVSLKPDAHRPFIGVLLLGLALTIACSSGKDNLAPPPPGVTVTPVVQRDVPIYQEWVGSMVGNVDAEIRPKVEGFLLSRLYTEGSYVQKGQGLFRLDARQAQASVQQMQGQLERAKAALKLGAAGKSPLRQRAFKLLRGDRCQAQLVSGAEHSCAVRSGAKSRARESLQGSRRRVETE